MRLWEEGTEGNNDRKPETSAVPHSMNIIPRTQRQHKLFLSYVIFHGISLKASKLEEKQISVNKISFDT